MGVPAELIFSVVKMAAGRALSDRIFAAHELPPQLRPGKGSIQAEVLGVAGEAATVAVLEIVRDQAATVIGGGSIGLVPTLSSLAQAAPVALTLGLRAGAEQLENRIVHEVLKTGIISKPGHREEFNTVGKLAHFVLHHGLQWGAFLAGFAIMSDGGAIGPEVALPVKALLASGMYDVGRHIIAPRIIPRSYQARQEYITGQRYRNVVRFHRPLRPSFNQSARCEWQRLFEACHFFQREASDTRIFTDRSRLLMTRAGDNVDSLCGLSFFVADSKRLGRAYIKDRANMLDRYYSAREAAICTRIREASETFIDEGVEESRFVRYIELKRSIWTFLTGDSPQTIHDWDPHLVELSIGEDRYLRFTLHGKLQEEALRRGITSISSSFTDVGYMCAGMIAFHRVDVGSILPFAIDLVNLKELLPATQEVPPAGYRPHRYFPKSLYRSRYSDGEIPTEREIALRLAATEAYFKAVSDRHSNNRLHHSMYPLIGPLRGDSSWETLQLSGKHQEALDRFDATSAELIVGQHRSALMAICYLDCR